VPFAFVYSPVLLLIDFNWSQFGIAAMSAIVAVMGLGAAYTGQLARPIGRLAFIALNALSLSLIFGNGWVLVVAAPLVLLILTRHATVGPAALRAT
jgi:TRAP-type uncharacterized transport system fused permease subunit